MTREMTATTQDGTQLYPLALVGKNRLRTPGRLQGSGVALQGLWVSCLEPLPGDWLRIGSGRCSGSQPRLIPPEGC